MLGQGLSAQQVGDVGVLHEGATMQRPRAGLVLAHARLDAEA